MARKTTKTKAPAAKTKKSTIKIVKKAAAKRNTATKIKGKGVLLVGGYFYDNLGRKNGSDYYYAKGSPRYEYISPNVAKFANAEDAAKFAELNNDDSQILITGDYKIARRGFDLSSI